MGTTERSITVNGDGKVTVRPDTASLSLGVQATGRTAGDALSQVNASGPIHHGRRRLVLRR